MNANDCRRKAEEYRLAAEATRDDLGTRLGWLVLCNAWNSLADRFDAISFERRRKARAAASAPVS